MVIDGVTFPEGYGEEHWDEPQKVVWVPVPWLLRNTVESCDYGAIEEYGSPEAFWSEVFTKAQDTGFGHLIESILERGFLATGAIGWVDGLITEGHHRLIAAILLCMDTVPISGYGGCADHVLGHHFSSHNNFNDPYPIEL